MYTNWRDTYKSRLTTFEDVVKGFKDGDAMTPAAGCCGPSPEFYELLFDRAISGDLKNFMLSEGVAIKPHKYHNPALIEQWFNKLYWRCGYFTPLNSPLGKLNAIRYLPQAGADSWYNTAHSNNVLYITVTPPNDLGFVSTGLEAFINFDLIEEWKRMGQDYTVIAEVNENMPWVFGDTMMHVSEIHHFVEHNSPLPEMQRTPPTEIEAKVGAYVAELLNDGDTFQMGWGGIPEAVISNLGSFRDLGVVSEVVPAGLPQLCEKGIVTNERKPFYKGISVASLCTGNSEMYEFMRENPYSILTGCKHTNDIAFIASHPNMKAINATAMIDLSGCSTAEGSGHTEFSGTGGQLEFVVGSHYSEGGASINLLASTRTTKDGKLVSNIVPELPAGTPGSIPRTMHDYIVTEYGIADLRFKDREKRADQLISIAHPEFREELKQAKYKNFLPAGYVPTA